jgi:hypothetical protein
MFHSLCNNGRNIYLKFLPVTISLSGTAGLITGLTTYHETEYERIPKNLYTHLMGHISLGILGGFVYPISFPLCLYHLCESKKI